MIIKRFNINNLSILRQGVCSSARLYSSKAAEPPQSAFQVFDKRAKFLQRERAASNQKESRNVDYLRNEVASRILERLAFISRTFENVLDLGSGPGNIENILCDKNTPDSELIKSRLKKITMLDSSSKMLYRDSDPEKFPFNKELNLERVVGDEEFLLDGDGKPYEANTFDAVISSMSLHWINDLPGILTRIQNALVPDGMFMCAMLGGDSLFELRTSLQLAEMERLGGVSPRLSPLADVKDIGGLLQKAKFNLLTVDVDDIIVSYPSVFELMLDLKAMGDSNAVLSRQPYLNRDLLLACDPIYRSLHGNEEDGSIPATFRIIYLIGWKPSDTQPKPLERGTATMSLKNALPQFGEAAKEK